MSKELTEEQKIKNRLANKLWREKNKEIIKEKKKEYYGKNKEIIKEKKKEYRENNLESIKDTKKEYYKNNKEIIIEKVKDYREDNLESIKEYQRKYRENNKNKAKEYQLNNKDRNNQRKRERKKNDPLFKLKENMRSSISNAIKSRGYIKESRTYEILGCSYEDFKEYIESFFVEDRAWMNWDNYGNPKDGIFEPNKSWDIDHIIPLVSETSEKEILELNHYTNLQPLCSYFNRFIKKGNY